MSFLFLNSSSSSSIRLAALGAIKNFVIAGPSRKAVLDQGLLEPCLRLALTLEGGAASIHTFSSILKLVAIMRLCCSGGGGDLVRRMMTASEDGLRLAGKVVGWSGANEAPAQVRDEATRFISVILKLCHDKKVISTSIGNFMLLKQMNSGRK